MIRLRKIYRTFIPFLAFFIGVLLVIFIMDSYAERLTRKPDLIIINGELGDGDTDPTSWQTEYEDGLSGSKTIKEDSLFVASSDAFNHNNYPLATEGFTVLHDRYPQSSPPVNYLGLISVRIHDYPAAIKYFSEALRIDPTYTDAAVNLASTYKLVMRVKDAEGLYKYALRFSPNDPDIHYNLGLLYFERKDLRSATASFEEAIRLSSGSKKARALCQLGIVKLYGSDTLSARQYLNDAILLEPGFELARINYSMTFSDKQHQLEELTKIYNLNNRSFYGNYYLGVHYDEAGMNARAEYHYRKALEINPESALVIEKLADLFINENRNEEAKLVIEGFIAGDTLPQAYFLSAKMAAREGKTGEAISLYILAISQSGNDYPEAFVNLAILMKEQNNFKEAIRFYNNAIQNRPSYALAYYNLALIYVDLDSIDLAIEAYQNAIRFDAQSFKSWYNLGQLYKRINQTDREIEAYKNAIGINPDYSRAMLELGNAYLKLQSYDLAVEAYEDVLEIYPKYSKAWFNLGLAYNKLDNYKLAINAYEKLLELKPDHIAGRINLSIIYSRTGDIDLAISTLEEAVNIDMANPDIRFNLALQYRKLDMINKSVYQLLRVIELDPDRKNAYNQLLDIYLQKDDQANYEIIAFRKSKNLGMDYDYYEAGKRLHELDQIEWAIQAYKYAQELGDENVWIDYWIGKAEMDLLHFDLAIDQFQKVIGTDAEHKFSLYRLGQIYEILNERSKAELYYSELIRIDPGFKIVRKTPLDLEANNH